MKSNLLLVLLSLLLPFELASAKSEFTKVPAACEELMTKFARRNGVRTLNDDIDWTEIRKNMAALGYSARIVDKKLSEIEFNSKEMLETIRTTTGNVDWNWRDGFTEPMIRSLGTHFGESYSSAHRFIQFLPIWSSLRGMDVPLMVNQMMKVKDQLNYEDQKFLSFYAPLWMTGPMALTNAKLFYKKTTDGEQNVASKWLSWNLPERIQPQFTRFLQKRIRAEFGKLYGEDDAWDDLKITAALPWNRMPANIRRHLVGLWVDLEKYPPITLDSVKHISQGYHDAGNCEYMTNGHMKSLGLAHRADCGNDFNDKEGYKKNVLIEVNGQLVGSLKRLGDHSMIALRNVFDSSGRLVLAMGGVYHIGQGIYDKLPARNANGRWSRVNLDQLLVHPHTYMLNDNGWTGEINTGMLLRLGLDEYTKEELVAMFDNDGQVSLDDDKRTPIWDALLARLNEIREELER